MKKKVLSLLQFAVLGTLLVSCKSGESLLNTSGLSSRTAKGYTLKEQFKSSSSVVYMDEDGQVIKINDPEDPEVNKLQSLKISNPKASLYYSNAKGKEFSETLQLSVTAQPRKASIGSLTWSSDNTSVASVDQNGLVTAISEGVANITATSAIGVKATSRVVVNNTNVLVTTAGKSATQILATQNSSEFEPLENVYVHQDYVSSKTCDGQIVSRSKFEQKFWISQPHSYFRIASDDEDIKTTDGSIIPSHTEYVFYTTEDYMSYVFCLSNNKSTYMKLDQAFLVDQGKSSYEGLVEILESFFKAGAKVMTNQLEDVLSQSELASNSSGYSGATYKGSLGEFSGEFAYTKSETRAGRVGAEDAADLGIPVGTVVTIVDEYRYLWENNTMSCKAINEKLSYTLGSKEYVEEFDIHYYYQARDVELLWPSTSDFTLVESLFDL